jgi:hypothetical protein
MMAKMVLKAEQAKFLSKILAQVYGLDPIALHDGTTPGSDPINWPICVVRVTDLSTLTIGDFIFAPGVNLGAGIAFSNATFIPNKAYMILHVSSCSPLELTVQVVCSVNCDAAVEGALALSPGTSVTIPHPTSVLKIGNYLQSIFDDEIIAFRRAISPPAGGKLAAGLAAGGGGGCGALDPVTSASHSQQSWFATVMGFAIIFDTPNLDIFFPNKGDHLARNFQKDKGDRLAVQFCFYLFVSSRSSTV